MRPPRQVGRVLGQRDLAALLDQPKGGIAQAARGAQPLDVRDRDQVVETTFL
jgi:hypothetical protein